MLNFANETPLESIETSCVDTVASLPLSRCLVLGSLWLSVAVGVLCGCESPPSVSPLLRASSMAVADEILHLQTDIARDREQLAQTRASLDAAFDADLEQAESNNTLNGEWIREAMVVYVPAREALVRHEATLATERQQRIDNLTTAVEAQQRALQLLERQDELIRDTTHFSVWRLINLNNPLMIGD